MKTAVTTTNSATIGSSEAAAAEQDDPGSCTESDPDQPPPASSTPQIEVNIAAGVAQDIDLRWLRDHVQRAINTFARPLSAGAVRVSITTDAQMAALHRRHGGQDTTTDVLTFDHRSDDDVEPGDIDIAICADVAAREAAARDHNVNRELLLYIVHGLLHCAGYDDHAQQDYEAMHNEEDRILREIGIGATFNTNRPLHGGRRS